MKIASLILLSMSLSLCLSVTAQGTTKELAYHVSKGPEMKFIYGKWICLIDSSDANVWTFTKDGKFKSDIYLESDSIHIASTFEMKRDTVFLIPLDGSPWDKYLVTQLSDKMMQWVYIMDGGIPGGTVDFRKKSP